MSIDIENYEQEEQVVQQIREGSERIRGELSKVIVGQKEVVEQLLITLFAGGHCLLTGAPGLAKTLLVRSIAQVFHLRFQRIQFTPDLMPADITGTEILEESPDGQRRLQFVKGPIFANVILADEINRTPPKTQAALLEAMQEHQVTAGGVRYPLDEPFFVLATQNPIEMEGTYPLPEAQLDRFMFNVVIDYLPEDDEVQVVTQTTSSRPADIEPIFSSDDVLRFHEMVRRVPIAQEVVRYAVRLAAASRPGQPDTPDFVNEWVSWGAGIRAGQYLVLGAKARALLQGRSHVSPEDIRALAHTTLRHRTLIGYRAEAEGVTVDDVIDRLLKHVRGIDRQDLCGAAHTTAFGRGGGDLSTHTVTQGFHRVAMATENQRTAPSAQRGLSFIDPPALMRIKNLQMRAKVIVEGFYAGIHRSPYHGFSVEFSEYRQYTPGDDLRYLDWRLLARTDRHYVKRFEDETNLLCYLLVDTSRSMAFQAGGVSKHEYARTLAATMGYFLYLQRDAVGLAVFDEVIREYLPPRRRAGHLRHLMAALQRQPDGMGTNVAEPLEQVARSVKKRGLVVLISDLLAPTDLLKRQVAYLRSRGHEMIILRVLDPAELAFSFDDARIFHDLESGKKLYIDPDVAKRKYLDAFQSHAATLSQDCKELGVELVVCPTDRPLELSLFDLLRTRLERGRTPARNDRIARRAR